MAQQTINIGTGELAGNGESIRSAFSKINNNFDELYSQGVIGPQGPQGFVGSTGDQGLIGYTGSIGNQGMIGYTGSAGNDGLLGYTGSQGEAGINGYTGSTGPIGYTGSQGEAGINGYTGSIGPIGPQGTIGYTGSAAGLPIPESKTIYVSLNGSDSSSGLYTYESFRTIKHALNQASPGDLVKISAGSYTEEFPLPIPIGVCVKGAGLRATEIKPTTATNSLNCFLLNGESTVEDLTIRDMFYDNVNDTGYAFSYNNNTIVSLRSPYIQRVTVLNKGSVTTSSDPYGFLSGDAGRGAIIDGSKVTRNSLQASMLFNEVTFIVPNSRAVIMTNGARSEFLNCFTYFADLAIEGKVSPEGRGGDGKTYIGLENITGTFDIGDTIDYYSAAGSLLASYVIENISGSSYVIDGNATGFVTYDENRPQKTVIKLGNAESTSTNIQFGTGSLLLDGVEDALRITEPVIPVLGSFTFEGWFYPNNVTTTSTLFFLSGNNDNYAGVQLNIENSQLKLLCSTNGSAWDIEQSTGTVVTSTWQHIAVQRSNNDIILHLNGEPIFVSNSISGSTLLMSGLLNNIGSSNNQNFYSGYIDDIRASNIPRYMSSSFFPPSTAFINDTNVTLLLHFDGNLTDDDGPIIQDIRSSSGAIATRISRYDRSEFAAELRAFACANVYGNFGVKANGPDVKLNLIAHNFGYIGTGFDLTNNRSAVVQANEILEMNGGRVYYDTVDQDGNYRIGDLFTVNFETGAVTFQGPNFDVSSLTGINFTDGSNTTIVNPTGIETGNLVLSGNSLSALVGGLTLNAGGNAEVTINGPIFNSGGITVDGKTAVFSPVPATSIGEPGDIVGLIAFSDTHIYRCVGTYDGVTDIWKRIAWSNDTW